MHTSYKCEFHIGRILFKIYFNWNLIKSHKNYQHIIHKHDLIYRSKTNWITFLKSTRCLPVRQSFIYYTETCLQDKQLTLTYSSLLTHWRSYLITYLESSKDFVLFSRLIKPLLSSSLKASLLTCFNRCSLPKVYFCSITIGEGHC